MLRQCGTIVFYSEKHKDFICFLDRATNEQIASTDIYDRDPSLLKLSLMETRLLFRKKSF